jgi:hypothetical protein
MKTGTGDCLISSHLLLRQRYLVLHHSASTEHLSASTRTRRRRFAQPPDPACSRLCFLSLSPCLDHSLSLFRCPICLAVACLLSLHSCRPRLLICVSAVFSMRENIVCRCLVVFSALGPHELNTCWSYPRTCRSTPTNQFKSYLAGVSHLQLSWGCDLALASPRFSRIPTVHYSYWRYPPV